MKKKQWIHIVPHSHWDREWYFSQEDSNILLVENLDYLIETLEKDEIFLSYTFDGQLSVIEDYLQVRPENKQRLQKLIAQKRILIGPWYTQSDSRIVHKEALIRNLFYGIKLGDAMGGSMGVGYLPDAFGQNAYLPSIFQNLGIRHLVFQRGVYDDQLGGNLNLHWVSPDGVGIKANNLYLGYGPGKFLTSEEAYIQNQLHPMLDKLSALGGDTGHLVLPSGGDQVLVKKNLPNIVQELNQKDAEYAYRLSDYPTYFEAIEKEALVAATVQGELIATQKSRVHRTIASQRIDIKQLNYQVEHLLIHILEPLAVIGQHFGLVYPQTWLDKAWKLLFDVDAHDSICGCNSDDTNRDIKHRLHQIHRMASNLILIIKKQITHSIAQTLENQEVFTVFNLLPKVSQTPLSVTLFSRANKFGIRDLAGKSVAFEVVEQTYVSGGKTVVVTANGEQEREIEGYYRTVVQLLDVSVPAIGWTTFCMVESDKEMVVPLLQKAKSIENEQYKICVKGKSLVLQEKQSQKTIENFLAFETLEDAGDSYDFSPRKGDVPKVHKRCKLVDIVSTPGRKVMTVEHSLSMGGTIKTTMELVQNSPLIKISHTMSNTHKNMRVRSLLAVPFKDVQKTFADQGFCLLERPTTEPRLQKWREQKYAEAPVPVYVMENFAAVTDEKQAMALFTKGNKEFEYLNTEQSLALTLFRSVGLLGRDNLEWRPGRASGINNKVVETPDAYLLQELSFSYSIALVEGGVDTQKLFAFAETHRQHYASYQLQRLNTFEERLERFEIPLPLNKVPAEFCLFAIDNPNVFMSVLKKAHQGDERVVRCFNPSTEPQVVRFLEPVQIVDLLEEPQGLPVEQCTLDPKGYVTYKAKNSGEAK